MNHWKLSRALMLGKIHINMIRTHLELWLLKLVSKLGKRSTESLAGSRLKETLVKASGIYSTLIDSYD